MFHFSALAPLIILASTAVIIMLVSSFYRNHKLIAGISVTGLSAAFISIFCITPYLPYWAEKLLIVDIFSIYFIGLTLLGALLINIISYIYFNEFNEQKEELYIMFQVSVLGAIVMISSKSLVTFFIGLELLTVPLYVMMAYLRQNAQGVEAAVKYFILAAASSSVLLFGMALLYISAGSMDLINLIKYFQTSGLSILSITGLAMVMAALCFKLAFAPFHMWTPGIYQGSPSPVTSFIATVSKGGTFAFALRLFVSVNFQQGSPVIITLSLIAALSMFTGNLLALAQNNVKRILACSSIAHFGYLLIALISGGKTGIQAASFYLSVYFISTIGAFSVIAMLKKDGSEADNLEDFKGLYFRNKFLAIVMASMLFSFAGMPLTAGFMSKFFIISTGAANGLWLLVWILIINSAIGLYYYLKIIYYLFKPVDGAYMEKLNLLPLSGSFVFTVLLIALFWLGLAPGGLLKLVEIMAK